MSLIVTLWILLCIELSPIGNENKNQGTDMFPMKHKRVSKLNVSRARDPTLYM